MAVYVRALTEEERAQLEEWQSDSMVRPALQQRALAILLSSQGHKTPDITREVGLHPLNVRKWIHRFNEEGVAGLHDRPRCGRPPKLDLGSRRRVWEIVATDPRALGCTHDTWTATRLMRYLRQSDLVDDVSYESVRQLFREAQLVASQIGSPPSATPAMSHSHAQRKQDDRLASALAVAAGTT